MKRTRLIIIAVAAAVLGFVAFAIFHSSEPRYQGRTLSKWIEDAEFAGTEHLFGTNREDMKSLTNDPTWQNASYAVKQMAPQAIPLLLKWVQVRDSVLKYQASSWLNGHPGLHIHIKTDFEYNSIAVDGFTMLGNDAKSAWPALIQLTQSPDTRVRWRALESLSEARFEREISQNVFGRLIHDPDKYVQKLAALMYFERFPEEAKAAGVFDAWPELRKREKQATSTNQPQNK